MVLMIPGVLTRTELTHITTGSAPIITSVSANGILPEQIQPDAIDLTLGNMVYGMHRAMLPSPSETVEDLTKRAEYSFSREDGEVGFLHQGYTYLIPLNERVRLPQGFRAHFSPKSSIGRTDTFVRVLADRVPLFDRLPDGYEGRLWLEVTPLSYRIKVYPGLSMVQMRLKIGDSRLKSEMVRIRQAKDAIFWQNDKPIHPSDLHGSEHGIYMHVDTDRDIVGFVSRSAAPPLALNAMDHDPEDYWDPVRRPKNGQVDLEPGRFYLLATKERIRVPKDICGEIMPYDASAGEFRTHYAGFFAPGFGGETGTTGVLEVRGRESLHSLADGQPICLMVFEQLCSPLEEAYVGNYVDPRPSLSKFFKNRQDVWEK